MARQSYSYFRCASLAAATAVFLVSAAVSVSQSATLAQENIASASPGAVLAPGKPPLTQELFGQFTRLMEWVLEVPLTGEQRDQIQTEMVTAWKKNDTEAIKGVLAILELRNQMDQLKPDERQAARAALQSAFLEEMRKDTGDPLNRSFVTAYDAAHKPLAPGDPPLTRQMTDAYAEMAWFTVTEVLEQPSTMKPDKKFKDEWAAKLAASYGTLDKTQRQNFAQLPLEWAGLRLAWPRLPEAEKAKLRAQWKAAFAPLLPKNLPPAVASKPAKTDGPWTPESEAPPPASATKAQRTVWLQRRVNAQQSRYQAVQNMVTMMGAAQYNVTSTLSGGGYRYEIRYR